MAYGVFDSNDTHIYTFDYGDYETQAEKCARNIGQGFYARELTNEEYFERRRFIIERDRKLRKKRYSNE